MELLLRSKTICQKCISTQFHERIADAADMLNSLLFVTKFAEIFDAEMQNAFNEFNIQTGKAKASAFEPIDEKPIAGWQAPQNTEKYFCHQRFCCWT
jgi:hypothetical protein